LQPGTYAIKALYSGTTSIANAVSVPLTIVVEDNTALDKPIMRDTHTMLYTLDGRRVVGADELTQLQSGIYIRRGEKIMVE
jgi:hypothetical protein